MNGRDLSLVLTVLVIVSGFSLVVTVLPEGVSAGTLYVGGGGPGNFTAIQDAINTSNPGDTIFVYSGFYPENISVYKPLSIIGEDRNTTEVGGKYGWGAVNINADWVNFSGFTVANGWRLGLVLDHAQNCSITNNIIPFPGKGIGVFLISSTKAVFRNNIITGSGFHIKGDMLENWNTHVIETSNTVNGKAVHYWKNVIGGKIPPGAGQVILANVTGVRVENQNIPQATSPILVGFSSDLVIANNTAHSNFEDGIALYDSDKNLIINNTAYNNSIPCSAEGSGISLYRSDNNTVEGNKVWSNGVSISVSGSKYNRITGNNASGSYGALWLGGDSNLITGNNITGGMEGILLAGDNNVIEENNLTSFPLYRLGNAIRMIHANENIIANNSISRAGRGLELDHSYRNDIRHNEISHSYGMVIDFSADNIVADNKIVFNELRGIELRWSDNNSVSGNEILGNPFGVRLDDSDWNIASNNNIGLSQTGFIFEESHSNTIADNNISHSEDNGLHIKRSDYNTIAGNSIMWSKGSGMRIEYSENNLLADNVVSHNTFGGIRLSHSDNNSILDSMISGSMAGIDLWYSDNNTILNDTVSENEYGIHLWHSNNSTILNNRILSNTGSGLTFYNSNGNLAYHNKFIDNVIQARDNGGVNQWDNGYPSGGNYWSDYSGDDTLSGPNQNEPGGDGLGDTPYIVIADGADMFPLISTSGPVFPRPPEILGAFLSGVHSEYVTITWALSPDDGRGLRSVVGYEVYRNTDYNALGLGYELIASFPNGTSGFVDYLAGEGDPNNYFYRVCAVDIFGNTTCAKEQAAKVSYPLSEGLNLVSIPLIQMDENVETVLQTLSFDKAWTYDSIDQEWRSYLKSKPYGGNFVELDHSVGVWVDVTDDSNLTVAGIVPSETAIQLHTGWNLVSFPSFNMDDSVADLKAQTGATRVEGFDASAPPYFLKILQDSDLLLAGYGYWVQVPQDTTWILPSA